MGASEENREANVSDKTRRLCTILQCYAQWKIKQTIISLLQTFAVFWMLHAFFWVIFRRMNSYAGELPRRKHTTGN